MSFAPEPGIDHGRRPSTGVLIVNLGTPDAPDAPSLRRYLGQFLSDPRVVEIPKAVWKPILHGIILRVRPAKSAAKYASIWTPEGSPLRVWTQRQGSLLEGYLGERGHRLNVKWAMRYGTPSVRQRLDELKAEGATRVLVVPLYPQYSGATTASAMDEVFAWGRAVRRLPELRFIAHFHDDERYISALAESVSSYWQREGRGDKLVMSFHGMPERTLHLGDPYHCECHKTARLLAQRLGLRPDQYVVSFQSRFGRAKWLEPYTEPTLRRLGQEGVRRVDVICPAFVSDCIETLEEIDLEGREAFLGSGGQDFHYIPCLNDRPEWMRALASVCEQHLQGWPTKAAQQPTDDVLQGTQARAKALGASR